MNLQGQIRELREAIRAKEDEIKKAQAEVAMLRAELEGAALLLKDVPISKRRLRSRRAPKPFELKPGSSLALAVEVLREQKHPLRLDMIVERVQEGGNKVVKSTLASNVSRAIKNNRLFVRVGKGMIGLQEWGADELTCN